MKFESHRAMPLEEMPRVTRQEFCERMEEILDAVVKDDTAYVITHESGQKYVLCPASWFEVRRDDDFDKIIVCAVRYAVGRDTTMPALVSGFVRRWMDLLEDDTLSVIARDIDNDLSKGEGTPDKELWVKLRDDIQEHLHGKE